MLRYEVNVLLEYIIYSLTSQAVQDNVGNGIDVKPSGSSASRAKQEHGSEMLVGDKADITVVVTLQKGDHRPHR